MQCVTSDNEIIPALYCLFFNKTKTKHDSIDISTTFGLKADLNLDLRLLSITLKYESQLLEWHQLHQWKGDTIGKEIFHYTL